MDEKALVIYIKGMMEVRKAKLAKHAHVINEGGAP